jgi:acyl carrier protein
MSDQSETFNETFEEIKSVIMEVMRIDGSNITPETRFIEDLKADSMDQFFLIDGFSERYNTAISDEDARNIKTVGDAVRYFEEHKQQG